jgi:reactive chlorine resistance protein C
MRDNINTLFNCFLHTAASAILIIFLWIGGLKFWNYEAEGIVPFVANSPFMSFFYNEKAPDYKEFKLKEGEADSVKNEWHEENNTYGFSKGLGLLIMSIGILTFLGFFSTKTGMVGELLVIIMTVGTLSFLVTTPECWVPNLGSGEYGFPLLTGAGRLVIKDVAIISGGVILLSRSARKLLKARGE